MKVKEIIFWLVIFPFAFIVAEGSNKIIQESTVNTVKGYGSTVESNNFASSVAKKLPDVLLEPYQTQGVLAERTFRNVHLHDLVIQPYFHKNNQQPAALLVKPAVETSPLLYQYQASAINLIPYSIVDVHRQLPAFPIRPMCGITTPLGGIFFPGRLLQPYPLQYAINPIPFKRASLKY